MSQTAPIRLRPVEPVSVDPDRLAQFLSCTDGGDARRWARQAMCGILDDLADTMAFAEAAFQAGRFARLAQVSEEIGAICTPLGLDLPALVAARVAMLSSRHDTPALAANLDRLGRLVRGVSEALPRTAVARG
ncbi:hypothetical protein EKE94_09870 [Mesobaculum littorinae]|uniref:HPt domain-containing protein n=1 Tax=Mesobaculum littorinae TaxID=2486419 RepID=A0A438AGG5_9RHOB|nr:hypothetical protein [Mesobaculum littorinae]RVV97784.1 hypothetical protein EKE94_09870 [Mesobaculum littorinae]